MTREHQDEPHVLVITGDDEEEREWEIEHPDCPTLCDWTPTMRDTLAAFRMSEDTLTLAADFDRDGRLIGRRNCYVQYETDSIGIDALYGTIDGVTYDGRGDGWRKLPAGRYIVRGWFTPEGWAGDYYDADGGIELIGREEARTSDSR